MASFLNIFTFFDDEEEGNEHAIKVYKTRRAPDESNFRSLYRFHAENVDFLENRFLDRYEETRGGALSNIAKIRTFLRYVGDPGFQVGVGEDIGVNQSTVSNMVWHVTKCIMQRSGEWIHFPQTENEFKVAKSLWEHHFKFHYAIGAIDCTLIPIKKPSYHGDEYICRKGFPAINVQATCDARGVFTSVDCSWAGSVHDARIWRNSAVQQSLNNNLTGSLLLDDEGYPLTPWLLTIYRNVQSEAQLKYNRLHKKERALIDRTFGQLKQRFPILHNKIRVSTERVPVIITACFVLHNVAKFLNDPDFEINDEECLYESSFEDDVDRNLNQRGKSRRQQITNLITYL